MPLYEITESLAESMSMIDAADYGARGDGVTDDRAAIQAAIDAAAELASGAANGAVVFLQTGIYMISDQLVVPNHVVLRGSGRQSTFIRPKAGYTATKPMIKLGAGSTVLAFGTRLEEMRVDAFGIANICVYSQLINEGSGLERVLLSGYLQVGMLIEETGVVGVDPDHFLLDQVDCWAHHTAVASIGIQYRGAKSGGQIKRFTAKPYAGAATQGVGIHVVSTVAGGCALNIDGANIEDHVDGILFDTNSGGIAKQVSGLTGGTNVVRIVNTSQAVVLIGVMRNATWTNTINNALTGAITTLRVPFYVAGHTANDGGYQTFMHGNPDHPYGHVVGNNQPSFRTRSTATAGFASRSAHYFTDGNGDGWRLRFLADGTNDPLDLCPITAGVVGAACWSVTDRGTVATGSGTTAQRPPANVGAGMQWYDTTLGHPIWSDGAAWKNALGVAV